MQEKLAAPFDGEVLQYTKEWRGRDGTPHSMTFDYIEDETVMDRLDAVVGVGNWYVNVTPISATCAKVALGVRFGDLFTVYEDFGYATRDDSAEPLKEAVSDGIRRCGRYVGIGRYLYHKSHRRQSPPAQAGGGDHRTSSRPVAATAAPSEPPWPGEEAWDAAERVFTDDAKPAVPATWEAEGDTCPKHAGRPWKATSRGYKCTARDESQPSGFCGYRPTKAWVARHEA